MRDVLRGIALGIAIGIIGLAIVVAIARGGHGAIAVYGALIAPALVVVAYRIWGAMRRPQHERPTATPARTATPAPTATPARTATPAPTATPARTRGNYFGY